jgi:hypothetical protein
MQKTKDTMVVGSGKTMVMKQCIAYVDLGMKAKIDLNKDGDMQT